MANTSDVVSAMQKFADSVKSKMAQPTHGEPEAQIRGPFETCLTEIAHLIGFSIVPKDETSMGDGIGKPDYAIHEKGLLTGYVELKAPGTGADTKGFSGRNREQWNRFQVIPNLLYCDGNEWVLYRSGKQSCEVVKLSGNIVAKGGSVVTSESAQKLIALLTDFFMWQPIIPMKANGKIDLREFAKMLAPLCRMLRDDVEEYLQNPTSPLVQLAKEWRQLLFTQASDKQFADAYAQTVTFALLLARSEKADPLDIESAIKKLAADHSLLSRALQILTDPKIEFSASLNLLLRVIGAIESGVMDEPANSWLYFYEDFLSVYDPDLRRDVGAYYTPVEVVRAQVRLVDDLLTNRLGKRWGFADRSVMTLDPAVGTGTYLLGVIEHALGRIENAQGPGAVLGRANILATNLYGFENLVGPYAVAELRVSRALSDRGVKIKESGARIYLTDTLESPNVKPLVLPLFFKPISEQHEKALKVKLDVPVIVCLGNPPYDRHSAGNGNNKARTGGWVRWGDDGEEKSSLLRAFLDPAIQAGHAVDVKNLYNLYVYFWRWALWKVFEQEAEAGPGIVSFITASSYLDGDAFAGLREHMRRICDEIWIIDIGGEARGTRKSENVFAIQTPVAIAIAIRYKKAHHKNPAIVRFTEILGTRDVKLSVLDHLETIQQVEWRDCPNEWQAPFRPAGFGKYFKWPLLTDLFPWQHSGVQLKRTWPIAPCAEILQERWRKLLSTTNRSELFRETDDRDVVSEYHLKLLPNSSTSPIAKLEKDTPCPEIRSYSYRSFDRQYIIADARLSSRPRPVLWHSHNNRQIYLTSLFYAPLGNGPALTVCSEIPDLHHFSGRGAKDAIPLYRDPDCTQPNVTPGLLELLGKSFGNTIRPEALLSYIYGILAHRGFTERFAIELANSEIRVPITKDINLFESIRDFGSNLIWLHTYGKRCFTAGGRAEKVPRGKTTSQHPIPTDESGYPESFSYDPLTKVLSVGDGKFGPVSPEVYEFEASGLKVVQSWLKYRMKKGAGKKSSELDKIRPTKWTVEFTDELLELLWVLEATVEGYPEQAKLLEAVVAGPCFLASELPAVPIEARKPPVYRQAGRTLFDEDSTEEE